MRALAIGVFSLLFILLLSPNVVLAAPSPTPTPVQCGVAGDPERNRCCPVVDVSDRIRDQFNVFTGPFGAVGSLLGAVFGIIIQNALTVDYINAIQVQCVNGYPDPATADDPNQCTCVLPERQMLNEKMSALCKKYISQDDRPDAFRRCMECAAGRYEQAGTSEAAGSMGGFYSGLGCVPTRLEDFVSNFVMRIGIGVAGMVSLACIIYSAILLQVSRGNPDTITKAREQITSCLIGLIMIVFSIFILRVIGVDILRIPGFG